MTKEENKIWNISNELATLNKDIEKQKKRKYDLEQELYNFKRTKAIEVEKARLKEIDPNISDEELNKYIEDIEKKFNDQKERGIREKMEAKNIEETEILYAKIKATPFEELSEWDKFLLENYIK